MLWLIFILNSLHLVIFYHTSVLLIFYCEMASCWLQMKLKTLLMSSERRAHWTNVIAMALLPIQWSVDSGYLWPGASGCALHSSAAWLAFSSRLIDLSSDAIKPGLWSLHWICLFVCPLDCWFTCLPPGNWMPLCGKALLWAPSYWLLAVWLPFCVSPFNTLHFPANNHIHWLALRCFAMVFHSHIARRKGGWFVLLFPFNHSADYCLLIDSETDSPRMRQRQR